MRASVFGSAGVHMPSAGGAALFHSLLAEGDLGRLESRGTQSHTRQQSSPERFMGGGAEAASEQGRRKEIGRDGKGLPFLRGYSACAQGVPCSVTAAAIVHILVAAAAVFC